MKLSRLISLVSLTLLPCTGAFAGMGGFMSACYNGSGFDVDKVCESKDVEANLYYGSHTFKIYGNAKASYTKEDGSAFKVEYILTVNDPYDFYNPEAALPTIFRVITSSGRSSRVYNVNSNAVVISRIEGHRKFVREDKVELTNSFGAEHVSLFEKIEILIPGAAGVAVLQF